MPREPETTRTPAEIDAWNEGYKAAINTFLAMRDATENVRLREAMTVLAEHLREANPVEKRRG